MSETPSQSFQDRPHDKRIEHAERVEQLVDEGHSKTEATQLVAKENNVGYRTISRATEYRDAFTSVSKEMQEEIPRLVNHKKMSVQYVRELGRLTPEEQQRTWDEGLRDGFPTLGGARLSRDDNKEVFVTVPRDDECDPNSDPVPLRQSHHIQALLARCGEKMDFTIWLPKSDRNAVLPEWSAHTGVLLDVLPLSYNSTTIETIEQIDVVWIKRRTIARAFEVEHTTPVYSGILRMADMLALLPDMGPKLHIVAPVERREKVLKEIQRPVFSYLDPTPLSEICSFLSYDAVESISAKDDLECMRDQLLEKFVEYADNEADS